LPALTKAQVSPNPPLHSDPACIAFRSLSTSCYLGSARRLGAGGAGELHSLGPLHPSPSIGGSVGSSIHRLLFEIRLFLNGVAVNSAVCSAPPFIKAPSTSTIVSSPPWAATQVLPFGLGNVDFRSRPIALKLGLGFDSSFSGMAYCHHISSTALRRSSKNCHHQPSFQLSHWRSQSNVFLWARQHGFPLSHIRPRISACHALGRCHSSGGPNRALKSDPACIAFRSLSAFRHLGSAHRLGAGAAA